MRDIVTDLLLPELLAIEIQRRGVTRTAVEEVDVNSFPIAGHGGRRLRSVAMPVTDQITLVDFRRPNRLAGQPIQAEHGLSLFEFICGGQIDAIRHHRWCPVTTTRNGHVPEDVLLLVPLDRRILTWGRDAVLCRAA